MKPMPSARELAKSITPRFGRLVSPSRECRLRSMSDMGHKRTNPPRAKLPRCPLLSESGQKSANLICPLSAKSGLMHCNMIGANRKTANAAVSPKSNQVLWSGSMPSIILPAVPITPSFRPTRAGDSRAPEGPTNLCWKPARRGRLPRKR
jgi:hypothetical protein